MLHANGRRCRLCGRHDRSHRGRVGRFGFGDEAKFCQDAENFGFVHGLGEDCIEDRPFFSDPQLVVRRVRRHCYNRGALVDILSRLDHSRRVLAIH